MRARRFGPCGASKDCLRAVTFLDEGPMEDDEVAGEAPCRGGCATVAGNDEEEADVDTSAVRGDASADCAAVATEADLAESETEVLDVCGCCRKGVSMAPLCGCACSGGCWLE